MPLTKVEKFFISKKLYALDLQSYTATSTNTPVHNSDKEVFALKAKAVWFKKKHGKLAVHIGICWDMVGPVLPPTVDEFLANYATARYGGRIIGIWNGTTFWSQNPLPRTEEDRLIERLDKYLKNYPDVPQGFSGWYLMT